MGKIIAVVNQKGGVGKTTTAVNLTAALHDLGLRVLLCDFDPQANATSGLGLDKRKCKYSVYDVLINDVPAADAIVSTPYGGRAAVRVRSGGRPRGADLRPAPRKAAGHGAERGQGTLRSDFRGLSAVVGAADTERPVRGGRDSGAGAV